MASTLAKELHLERGVLIRLRNAFDREDAKRRPKAARGGVLDRVADGLRSVAELLHVPAHAMSKVAHQATEHVYSSGGCKCRDYL